MTLKFKLTHSAKVDVAEIISYLLNKNPAAALKQKLLFEAKFEFLCQFPMSGRLRSEFGQNCQSIVEGNYIIFYIRKLDEINILRVLHSSRDIEQMLSS